MPKSWLWILVGILILVPAGLLLYDTSLYENPLVAFLLSVLIAAVSVVASRSDMLGEVRRKTQTEWLSQAEGACDRLLTTAAQVRRLAELQAQSCGEAVRSVPELNNEENRSVKLLLSSECKNTSVQLKSIYEHLESAILDWERFIRKNCEDTDCLVIGEALTKRRMDLSTPPATELKSPCGSGV